jgi:hypothetical protein
MRILATGPFEGLLVLLFAVAGFAVVALVAGVVLVLLHAVLPGEDSGAEAVRRAELERAEQERGADGEEEAGDSPELRSGGALG